MVSPWIHSRASIEHCAEVLFDAAEKAICVAHLALLTHWQHGSHEGGDFGYGGRRSERWISYDDEMAPRPAPIPWARCTTMDCR